jgi:hypothetical protein
MTQQQNEAQGFEKFDAWAIVEVFGHKRFAGRVSDQAIGGASFIRIDVPATTDKTAYTKFFGGGAIYAITPCTEEVARIAAHEIEKWNDPVPVALPGGKQLPAPRSDDDEEDDDVRW